jgi:hypothetical protein
VKRLAPLVALLLLGLTLAATAFVALRHSRFGDEFGARLSRYQPLADWRR